MIRNLAQIRNMVVESHDPSSTPGTSTPRRIGYGRLIVEALKDLQRQIQNVATQGNASLTARQNPAPPPIDDLHVDGGGGIYHAYITHNSQNLYRGVEYTLEYSHDNWQTFHAEHFGPVRDKRLNLGITGPLQFRAYAGYGPSSPPSAPVYAAGPVSAYGNTGPELRPGQGSGTAFPSQGAAGYGFLPWRGNQAPKRS